MILLIVHEDPQKMMDQMIREMQEQLRDAKIQVAKAIADEKRLQHQLKQNETQSQNWEISGTGSEKGDERLAKEALKQRPTMA